MKMMRNVALILTMLLASMLLFGLNGSSYIDPSIMTYLIQAIAGVVIAGGVILGVYLRRAKKKISDKLGIDENRNKEIESDEIEIKIDSME